MARASGAARRALEIAQKKWRKPVTVPSTEPQRSGQERLGQERLGQEQSGDKRSGGDQGLRIDVVVIGLGYVGLPLAQEATRAGLHVVGFDVSERVVAGLNEGRSHVDDLSDDDVRAMLDAGFTATADPTVIGRAGTVVICVPTPLTPEGGPDLGAVLSATAAIAANLRRGQLVILESTTYPGTTSDEVRPILEAGGLVAGDDFHLAFSPERIDPGNPVYGMRNTPKVVGGHTDACTDAAERFYGRFVDTVVRARGTREAEMAKLLENTYRHINIALVNEMARFCHELDIDLWDVINAAKSKPFGFQAFYPGPGVGGHCIPIDPNYLSYQVQAKLGYPFRFVELAQEINAGMPAYVVRRIQDLLNEDAKALRGSRICLLGVTYKPDIADQRESPAMPIAVSLMDRGAEVVFHDPHVTRWRLGGRELDVVSDLDEAVATADAVVLLQNHRSYDADALAAASKAFLDTRGVTTHPSAVRL
jgi:UDP-N-acetyl-D-glucosamine dehydrogenase